MPREHSTNSAAGASQADAAQADAEGRRPTTGSPPIYVDRPQELESWCRRWSGADALAVDTEFVRERTFYPALGLVQVGDGDANVLVDPLALENLDPLRGVLTDARIVKVLHSCSEDMEVFYYHLGEVPWPVFDTQIAAAFAGYGYSLGLGGLIAAVFGVELPKQHTRTNWLRRPLSAAQKEYAGLDVAYLLPIYDHLGNRLRQTGREPWVQEELEALRDTARFETDPEDAFLKFRRARGLDRRQLAVLRELAVWRETEARRRDLPRGFVLRDAVLPELARRQPRNQSELREIRALRDDELRRHGRTLLGLIHQARALPSSELPEPVPRPFDLSPYKRQVELMRQAVVHVADDLDLPVEVLVTRRSIESVARRVLTGSEPYLPSELRGWRRAVVGECLLEAAVALAE